MRKLALFLFAAALTLPALAQNLRVSQPLADALGSGKYYMRLTGSTKIPAPMRPCEVLPVRREP